MTYYTIDSDLTDTIRIVQLSDLHNAEFGKNNSKLIQSVEMQSPNLIVMTGDMLNEDDRNDEIVTNLVSDLNQIAPVYFSYGNHESAWERKWNKDVHQILDETGATVLECEYADVEIKGQKLRIGGYMAYWLQPHMMASAPEQMDMERNFYDDFKDTDRYRILLNHIPTQWLDWNYIDIDSSGLVFSGHYHGGVVRIPLINRGIYAPYVGWFPKFTKGVFVGEQSTCVLSAGLGTEHHIPRINNPPEIVVVDLVPNT